jgi:cellulase/cellobiase CelA1
MLRSLRLAIFATLLVGLFASGKPALASPAVTARACSASYVIASQWPTGFMAYITVTNTGNEPITGWTVVLVFPDPVPVIQQWWSSSMVQTNDIVVIRPRPWNSHLAPGSSTGVRFVAAGVPVTPTSITCVPD